ncbi:hypothetical protein BJX63DRAFT_15477 [Aspergillus granulosus]|uniref:Uncharacterized protein n=1 Tax=Aspergillus granulosus TaxID=176169 RepID=A0ABR4H092_9EURO
MLIPLQLRQLGPRQVSVSDPPNNDRPNESNGPTGGQNNVFIIVAAVVVFVVASLVILYFVLRTLRRTHSRPKYIPGKWLKGKWERWNVGASYGQVPGGSSANQPSNAAAAAAASTAPERPPEGSNTGIRRDTSIRSIITLPAYSYTPKPTEQVIAREGERGGMDMVVEFPETAEEEEDRREEMMESLYQIRLQRRQEIAEREERRRERREARERGDFIRLEQLRVESRQRANSRESVNGNTSVSASVAVAEAQSRGRERRISSVTYADVGYVRHDGSRLRASSRDSDSRPLLMDAAAMSSENPDRSSGLSVHSRGESYSSSLSLPAGGSDGESLTPVQSHTTSLHSVSPLHAEPEDGDVGARNIPPPDYDHLDWGEAPPYEPSTSHANTDHPPQLRDITPLPTIQIDIVSPVSPVSNGPPTPTSSQQTESRSNDSSNDSSSPRNNTPPAEDTRAPDSSSSSAIHTVNPPSATTRIA